jgi:hypothetical protein
VDRNLYLHDLSPDPLGNYTSPRAAETQLRGVKVIDSNLRPDDREAISQLRTLLRGEHGLSSEREEQLIAEFLAGRAPATTGQERTNMSLRTQDLRWGKLLAQPAIAASAAVGVVSLAALQVFWLSNQDMVLYGPPHHTNGLAALLAVVGLVLLGVHPLRVWLNRRGSRGEELLTTVVGSAAGAGFLEAAVLHLTWDVDQAVNLMNAFVLCNVLALLLAVLVGAIGVARTMPRRLSSAARPARRLYGHGHGVGDIR